MSFIADIQQAQARMRERAAVPPAVVAREGSGPRKADRPSVHPDKKKSQRKTRDCLGCGGPFRSEGIHNRLCGFCKDAGYARDARPDCRKRGEE